MALTFTGGVRLQQGSFKASITPIPSLVNAVNFDGTNDYLRVQPTGGLTGAVDGKDFMLSFWTKVNANGAFMRYLELRNHPTLAPSLISRGSDNKTTISLKNTSAATGVEISTTNTITIADDWVHVLASINTATGVRSIYFNDVLQTLVTTTFISDTIFDFTLVDVTIGGASGGSGVQKINGDVSEYYFTNESLDLSIETNRRKFISATGKPVDLGEDGSTPTGTAALIYLSGPTVNWHINKGTGGGFTENGALTDASTSPSD